MTNTKTVSTKWLESAAAELEQSATESLQAWILMGVAQRYSNDMDKAAILRKAAGIKSIADRRLFLRGNGVEA